VSWSNVPPARRLIARGLRLPAAKLDRIEAGLGRHFGTVTRRQLRSLDVFAAA
jgi:hypothetical protein